MPSYSRFNQQYCKELKSPIKPNSNTVTSCTHWEVFVKYPEFMSGKIRNVRCVDHILIAAIAMCFTNLFKIYISVKRNYLF